MTDINLSVELVRLIHQCEAKIAGAMFNGMPYMADEERKDMQVLLEACATIARLRTYVTHKDRCGANGSLIAPCTCGLEALLSKREGESK